MSCPAVELGNRNRVSTRSAAVVQGINIPDRSNTHTGTPHEFRLPPTDTGKDAWLFLAACWAVEALVWGFGFSFGVFQDYYSSHLPFQDDGNIAVVGTTTLGVMYITTPFVIALCRLRPRWARWFTLAGLVSASLTMALSSLCTTVAQLIATQGVLFGIGGCFAYCPSILYIDEWFSRRKGMAYGIMWSAAGVGGVVLPLLLEFLLTTYGFRTALRVWAVVLFLLSFPLSFLVRPRLPIPPAATAGHRSNLRCVLSTRFLLHQFANIVQATGYFLPGVYLPSYVRAAFGVSTMLSALTVLLVNVAAAVGSVVMGWMTDRLRVTTCLVLSGVGASVAALVLWGLASTLAGVYAFCVAYGLFAGCYTSIWPGIMREIARPAESEEHIHAYIDPSLLFGLLCAGRGIGNVVSGPLSDLLIRDRSWLGQATGGYGSGYGSLIVYTGVTAAVGGSAFFWRRIGVV
ncbi:major facilitator superfamily domain-containing protein [Chaetomium fimeti]|uniref:Major facilitator superfamily domain-containing protein n=1 Tax=Chaetomium fimeti TaxID=1854472 RepID=A0AAE0LN14_9PEZI|nr:major facilitator superfamily domain-containing protein [Chaetomium fimeti]